MRILIADKFEKTGVEGLQKLGCDVVYEPGAGAAGLAEAIAKHRSEVLIVRSSKVNASTIALASSVKAIIRAGAGVDNIDLNAATERGIGVCNCPGMNAIAVAELTMGLLLACDRKIADQTRALATGSWNKKEFSSGARGLKGATLLLVGLGAIGKAVAKRALAFEMDVVGWSRSLTPAAAKAMGIRFGGTDRAALQTLLGTSDAVSVHMALTSETKKFCDAAFFQAMKPSSIFINTSRGEVVDESAMREVAKMKSLRLGLDVYENQPAQSQAPFVTPTAAMPNSAFTHHCGASTEQAQAAVADEVVRIVDVYSRTRHLENCVNERSLPEVKTGAAKSGAHQ